MELNNIAGRCVPPLACWRSTHASCCSEYTDFVSCAPIAATLQVVQRPGAIPRFSVGDRQLHVASAGPGQSCQLPRPEQAHRRRQPRATGEVQDTHGGSGRRGWRLWWVARVDWLAPVQRGEPGVQSDKARSHVRAVRAIRMQATSSRSCTAATIPTRGSSRFTCCGWSPSRRCTSSCRAATSTAPTACFSPRASAGRASRRR